jgi:hypothetical protein
MRRSSGLTLIEVALSAGVLAMTTLTFASAMASAMTLDGQSRERAWARAVAQKQLEAFTALSPRDVLSQYAQPREFSVGFDLNGDGTLSAGELLIPAPPSGENPPRAQAGRMTVDFSHGGLALIRLSVRWRSYQGQPQELVLHATVCLEH